ncbi:MAG: DUF853 family protein [Deltaproteobacteria bacterium]|nr:DUF853 family protein [Deltaproteobacteria bacterium]
MSKILVGKNGSGREVYLLTEMANRHGLISGATGTGKTITLRVLTEAFSDAGIPVFAADVKGDLSGVARTGTSESKPVKNRIELLNLQDFNFTAFPVEAWDLYSENGVPLRTTISEFGPILLARVLDLNDTQQGVLSLAFRLADENGLLILDLKDLRAVLSWLADNSSEIQTTHGNVSKSSIGAIQRSIIELEEAGGDSFFGEPALTLPDLMRTDSTGRGMINLLDATKLINDGRLYSTFLLWLLSELFEQLPEIGDAEKPKFVFFFDEAHLLFANASEVLQEKIEQVVRLIRSRGVAVFFVTQNPIDIPEKVLGQLGNRIQHALRAYSPRDQKAVKAAADTFRPNPAIDTERAITELAVGEALVSCLSADGVPEPVERTMVVPPRSRLQPLTQDEQKLLLGSSATIARYGERIDRESAYEALGKRLAEESAATEDKQEKKEQSFFPGSTSKRQGVFEAFVKSAIRSVGSQIGRALMRGILGTAGKR